MDKLKTEEWRFTDVRFLPIFKEYAKRINLVETINTMVATEMDLSPGDAVLALILDTLTGRTPLYRLEDSLSETDTELLLGKPIDPSMFNDTNVGRVLDQLFHAGSQKIFSQISQNAIGCFKLDTRHHHFDTTSVSVFGDYDHPDPPLNITYGYSKDKRPDLKQFMISMLCVDRNIPIIGKTQDGNSSDKTLNNELLSNISAHMAEYGFSAGASIYIADSAFVATDNLAEASRANIRFLSRLPANFSECKRAISGAVAADEWLDIGVLAKSQSEKRPAAFYRYFDTMVTIEETVYRAVVFHSSAYDKRRQKRIDGMIKNSKGELGKKIKEMNHQPFKCLKDPAIVNAIFLKKPERVEALGLILLLSLLLWRLVERDLRLYVKETDTPLPGWKKQPTRNPTSFMMTTKFLSILVITIGKKRKLAKPLTKIQLQYLKALEINPECFISP